MIYRSLSATGRFSTSLISRRLTGISDQAAGGPSFHSAFDQLLPFGIDPEPGQLPRRAHGHISLVGTTNLMATRSPAFAKEIIADRGERLEGSSRTL